MRDSLRVLFRLFVHPTVLVAEQRNKELNHAGSFATLAPFLFLAALAGASLSLKVMEGCGWEVKWGEATLGVALGMVQGAAVGALVGWGGAILSAFSCAVGVGLAVGNAYFPAAGLYAAAFCGLIALLAVVAVAELSGGVVGGDSGRAGVAATVGALLGGLLGGIVGGSYPELSTYVSAGIVAGASWAILLGLTLGIALATAWGSVGGTALGLLICLSFGIGIGVFQGPAAGAYVSAVFLILYFRLEWYGVDAGGMLWQLTRARRKPSAARELFQRSPIYWREPIWLPLPGLGRFLRAVAEQDYGAGVEESLFVLRERPLHARPATTALAEITLHRLTQVSDLQEMADAAESIGWAARIDSPVHPRLRLALPVLEELGVDARQYLTATLPHNRRRALERLREGAAGLERAYRVMAGSLPRAIIDIARHWQHLAHDQLNEMEREEPSGSVRNPFVFGQPIEETEANLFVGRRDIVREMEISLLGGTQKPALVLWGPRRMGKTSVLMQLPRLLGKEFAPAFVDMQAMHVRESVPAFLHSMTQQAEAALRRRRVAARVLELPELRKNAFSVFESWLKEVAGKLGEEHYLLLCLDEYERLEESIVEGKLPRQLMDEIRHIIQHHPRILLLLAGSHRPDQMTLNWPDVLISSKLIRVSYLSEEEARQLITEPVPNFEIAYAAGSVERILEVTRCQPNLVQVVCYELVNHLNGAGRREARSEDVDVAVEQAFQSARLYFAEMWGQLNEGQRSLLRVIAATTDGVDTNDVAKATGEGRESVAIDLQTLAQRSILEAVDEAWRFQVPMVGEWVRTRSAD